MRIITKLTLICLFITLAYSNAYGHENCGCMDATHDTVQAGYKQMELENSVILNENKFLSERLKQKYSTVESQTSLGQIEAENAMIRSESKMIAKHLSLIENGMSDDEHIEMMDEYNDATEAHAAMLKGHKELFIKLNRQ